MILSVVKKLYEEYKFSICFENAINLPGYITEKIFECFFAGCIPVYLGANNVEVHIPSNCFIDFRKFNNYDELYNFMSNMNDSTILEYQTNIQNFLNSKEYKIFTNDHWKKVLLHEIKLDISN